jgi:hypothetical protein
MRVRLFGKQTLLHEIEVHHFLNGYLGIAIDLGVEEGDDIDETVAYFHQVALPPPRTATASAEFAVELVLASLTYLRRVEFEGGTVPRCLRVVDCIRRSPCLFPSAVGPGFVVGVDSE